MEVYRACQTCSTEYENLTVKFKSLKALPATTISTSVKKRFYTVENLSRENSTTK